MNEIEEKDKQNVDCEINFKKAYPLGKRKRKSINQ